MLKYIFGIILVIIGIPMLLLPFAPGTLFIIIGLGYVGINFGKEHNRHKEMDSK